MNDLLKEYELSGDGTGFFDAYEKEEFWINKKVNLHLVHRRITDDTLPSLKNILDNKNQYDKEWKNFIAENLLNELKDEWDTEELTTEKIISELMMVDLSFGYYDAPHDFNLYFIPENVDSEHGVVLLCDKDGNPLKAHIE